MKAMILAAGRGTRLKPLTDRRPKPMMEVGGAPLIGHQLRWLAEAGASEVIINLHHLGEQVEAYVGDGRRHGLSVAYSRRVGVAGNRRRRGQGAAWLGDQPFWLLNGDIHTDFPFRQFAKTLVAGCTAHLLLTPTPAFRESGDFEWEPVRCQQGAAGQNKASARELPKLDAKVPCGRVTQRGGAYVFCGLALLHPALFDGCKVNPSR